MDARRAAANRGHEAALNYQPGASINRVREVYFVHAPAVGMVKIGVANTALVRMDSLRTMSPTPLVLLGVLVCDRRGALEREIHELFAHLRSHGEWFHAASDLMDFITKSVEPARPAHHYLPDAERAAYEEGEALVKERKTQAVKARTELDTRRRLALAQDKYASLKGARA